MRVYHGTTVKLEVGDYLKPHKAFEYDDYFSAIHFTDNFAIAVLYSINPIKSFCENNGLEGEVKAFSAHINFDSEPIMFNEIYENMLEELFNKPSYVYVCEPVNLEKSSYNNWEFTSKEECKIVEVIKIPNLLVKLKELEKEGQIKIRPYDEVKKFEVWYKVGDDISSRASYCNSQCEYEFFIRNFKPDSEIIRMIPLKFKK